MCTVTIHVLKQVTETVYNDMKMKLDLGILIQDCVENMKINYGTKLFLTWNKWNTNVGIGHIC